jgi:hypothetical protein
MHTNLNVSVFEFNRRSDRPHFEFAQLDGRNVLQCSDPLSWNQEASFAVRDDLNGIPLGDVADSLRPNLGLGDLFRTRSGFRENLDLSCRPELMDERLKILFDV